MIRFFITPRIKQLQKGQPRFGHCWRECGNIQADHFHIFWDCPVIRPYWLEVVEQIKAIMGFEIKHDFCTIYLGNISSTINSSDKYLIKIMLAASEKVLTKRWLSKEPPTRRDWIGTVREIYNMGKLNLCMAKFSSYWRKWTINLDASAPQLDNE